MITYEWADSWCEHPEVAQLLEVAAELDAEQGFSARPPMLDPGPGGEARTRELVAWMTRDVGAVSPGRKCAVAFLRVCAGPDGDGVLELLVHPDFRSLGVGTLLLEELGFGVSADGGWAGTGATSLRTWARGSHPAAERMARRFHADIERSVWRIVRPGKARDRLPWDVHGITVERVGSEWERDELVRASTGWLAPLGPRDAEVLVAKDSSRAAAGFVALNGPGSPGGEAAELGTIHALGLAPGADGHAVRAALLSRAVDRLTEEGAREVDMLVNAVGDDLVRTCRLLGFHHDQTDLCFRVPLQRA
ncbi:MAG TPA: GNAT family N-acetyltransferase [Amycolatopsis sp.]|nr:GNAT family N-acetyltransferase [Amycolatopsis sp.]